MNRTALFFALFLYILKPEIAAAADQSLESALNQQYHDKILALRHPLEKASLAFDADGKVLQGGHEGPWTLYGRILVKNIRLEKNSIRIEGERLNYFQIGRDLAPTPAGNVKIEIKQATPAASAEEMNALLGQVFALTDEEMIASVPEFWRKYLKDQVARAHGEKPQEGLRRSHPDEIKVIETPELKDGEPVAVLHKLGGGTIGPKPRYTPEPGYTEAARRAKYQGTLQIEMIVDETGAVKRPRIILPLGMGLDENAVDKALTWKFDPARMDGKPVPVILRIEVTFRLY
jgi:TonB family protein